MGDHNGGAGRKGKGVRVAAGRTAGVTRQYQAPQLTVRELRQGLFEVDDQDQTVASMIRNGTVTLNVRAALRPYARNSNITVRTLRQRLFALNDQGSIATPELLRRATLLVYDRGM